MRSTAFATCFEENSITFCARCATLAATLAATLSLATEASVPGWVSPWLDSGIGGGSELLVGSGGAVVSAAGAGSS
jgi:hypothetical protein